MTGAKFTEHLGIPIFFSPFYYPRGVVVISTEQADDTVSVPERVHQIVGNGSF